MVKIIDINSENVGEYGLFCRKSYMKEEGNKKKVHWLKKRFEEGLKYKLLLVKERGKLNSRGFIEYIPGEFAWRGINAKGWMSIICLWVTGQAKKKGYGSKLLNEAIKDAKEKGMNGVVGMTAKKQGWLPRPDIYEKNGFEMVDEYEPYFGLYAKSLKKDAPTPTFIKSLSDNRIKYSEGITVFYTHQCPHILNMIKEIEELAKNENIPIRLELLSSAKDVKEKAIHPYGVFSVLYKGELITYKPGMRKETLERLKERF
ncbi:MAG: hypothetical protein BAJALOKI1v1_190018 [Promethearchaeota archaeon]|nr:MAG: hypothetical protein BAJALOKI1v1_190018 [Candidatus Lokiarchaeota archaeon]